MRYITVICSIHARDVHYSEQFKTNTMCNNAYNICNYQDSESIYSVLSNIILSRKGSGYIAAAGTLQAE